ncbi:MAG: hypothetical protein V4463_11515 [Pseudomonadota bacterium]
MNLSRHLPTLAALLLAAWAPAAIAQQGEWASYRDAYRAMVVFEKYGKPKHFLQNQLQVVAREKGASVDGVHLSLHGKTTRLNLPLDALGRTSFPLLKAAYDENAELVLNRTAGEVTMRPRLSIMVRQDGVYEAADLHAACEQALNYQRYVDAPSYRNKHCLGVRFSFAKKGPEAAVRIRDGATLGAFDGTAFADEVGDVVRTVDYRFAQWPGHGQVVSQNLPLAIAPLFD